MLQFVKIWFLFVLVLVFFSSCKEREDSAVFYRDGIKALERNSYHTAIKSLQRFVKLETDTAKKANAYNALGIALKRIGQVEAATQAFKSSLELKPDYAEALYNLATIMVENADEASAVPLFIRAADVNTNDTYALTYLSEIYLKNRDYENARNVLLKAKERQPYSAEILCRLAVVELRTGNINKALIRLQESLEQNAKYAPAIFNMALITHYKLKDYEQARAYYKAFLKIDNESGYAEVARNALREIEAQKTSAKASEKTSQQDIDISSKKTKAEQAVAFEEFMQLARIAEKQKKYDVAVQNYLRVAEVAEKKNETLLKGQALARAAELCGKDPELNFLVGNYYFTRSMFKEAVPFLKTATIGRPKWYEAHLELGKAAIETGEFDTAALALKQADTLKPQNGDALWQLALLYDHSLKIKSKAISLYSNFIERFPDDYRVPEARARIADIAPNNKPQVVKQTTKEVSSSNESESKGFFYKLFHKKENK